MALSLCSDIYGILTASNKKAKNKAKPIKYLKETLSNQYKFRINFITTSYPFIISGS